MKFFTDDQFDEFIEYLTGMNISKKEALQSQHFK